MESTASDEGICPHSPKAFEDHRMEEDGEIDYEKNEDAVEIENNKDEDEANDGENNQQNLMNSTEEGEQNLKVAENYKKKEDELDVSAGFYPSVSEIIGTPSMYDDEEHSSTAPKIDERDINNHLKGALSFGLPNKTGGGLTFNRPYRSLGRKSKYTRVSYKGRNARLKRNKKIIANNHRNHLIKKSGKLMEGDNIDHLSDELKLAYRIVTHLMSDSLKSNNSIFLETIEMDPSINGDYLEVVKEPIWLPKIKDKLLANEYKSITEVISQIRLMLENTYRYFGTGHSFSKRGLRMEYTLEQKLAQLPEDKKTQCTLEATQDLLTEDFSEATRTKGCCIKINGENYFSYLMFNVRDCRPAREKELRKRKFDMMRQAKQSKEMEFAQWEESLTSGSLGGPVKHMWEIVHINQFLYLSMKMLNITEISQYELERVLMIPESSITLRMVMTSLLLPKQQRAKLAEKPYMPYGTWVRRLASKTIYWYRMYAKESQDSKRVRDQLGIEPKFWEVCGQKNPFDFKLFHEMTLYQRVWLLKTLCDHIYHTHKSIQECITEQDEENLDMMREEVLGRDRHGFEYIHFPQFKNTDVRIYKRTKQQYSDFEKQWSHTGKITSTESCFSKSEVKSFKKFIKKLKKKRNVDEDWEKEERRSKHRLPKKKNRRKESYGSGVSVTPSTSNSPGTSQQERRSRPQWLRQTPKPRYSFQADSDSDGRGDSPYQGRSAASKFLSRKKRKGDMLDSPPSSPSSEEDDDSDIDEGFKEDSELEDDFKDERVEKKQQNRKNKSAITPKDTDDQFTCDICKKVFLSKIAKRGHMGIHKRRKEKGPSTKNSKMEDKLSTEAFKNAKDEVKPNELPIHEEENCRKSEALIQPNKFKTEKDICDKVNTTKVTDEEKMKLDINKVHNVENGPKSEPQVLSTEKEEKNDGSQCVVAIKKKEADVEKVTVKRDTEEDAILKHENDCPQIEGERSGDKKPDDDTPQTDSIELKSEKDCLSLPVVEKTPNEVKQENIGEQGKIEDENDGSGELDEKQEDSPSLNNETKIETQRAMDTELPSKSTKDQCDAETNATPLEDGPISRCSSPSDGSSTTGGPCNTQKTHTENPSTSVKFDNCEFELVASSFSEFRTLIQIFGPLPLKYAKEKISEEGGSADKQDEEGSNKEEDEEEMEEEGNEKKDEEQIQDDTTQNEETDKKVPRCEEKLHKALCHLLMEWAPFESKINAAQKQIKKKLWNEFLEWSKRDENFIDPAEEVWNSDPEPEPAPPPSNTQTPKPSSSSSSEETYNEDGTRKRKLRKRKVKRITIEQDSRTPSPELDIPSSPTPSTGKVAISSRGRVRKVKHIMNYDRMDFEKLAEQAEKESTAHKEKKRKRKEDNDVVSELMRLQEWREKIRLKEKEGKGDLSNAQHNNEKALEKAAQSLSIPSSGVKRYIISKTGQVIGYIGNDGQIHTGLLKQKGPSLKQNESDRKEILRNNPLGSKIVPDKIPKVVLSAVNQVGNPVYVRMVGNQALELMKIIKDAKCGPPRQIKLQRFSQTYTFNTNSEVLTQNIPGYPDCDTSNPLLLSQSSSTASQVKVSNPSSTSAALSSQNKDDDSNTEVNTKYSGSKGVVAQAIESAMLKPRLSESCSLFTPSLTTTTTMPLTKKNFVDHPTPTTSSASLSASTRLVFASQSTVPSVPPITPGLRPCISEPSGKSTGGTPLFIQTENGQQLQVGLNEKLSQIVQKTGQRIVAVPNDKGGYTISLISNSNVQQQNQGSNTNKIQPNTSQVNSAVIRAVVPRAVPSNIISVAPSNAIGSGSAVGIVKTQKVETQSLVSNQQQHIAANLPINPQILNASNVGRQILIQQPTTGQNSIIQQSNTVQNNTPVLSKVNSSNQIVQIAQGQPTQVVQLAQPQPQILQIAQQGTQKLVQIIPTTMTGRQVIHMVQPGQVFMSPNSVTVVRGSVPPAASSNSVPQNVIQVAQPQSSQPIQIQNQTPSNLTHTLQLQQHQQQQPPTAAAAASSVQETDPLLLPSEPLIQLPNSSIPQMRLQAQPQFQETWQKPQSVAHSVPLQQSNSIASSQHKPINKSQVGRLLIVQTNDGQKVCLQLPDGKLSVLSPEQLQPFIASGAIKINNS